MPDGFNIRGGMRGFPRGGMPHEGMNLGPRRFPRFFFFPIFNGFPRRCDYIDRYGRCCDSYGRCCDQFGRCGYDDFYGGSPYPLMPDMNTADNWYGTPGGSYMMPGMGNTNYDGSDQY